MLLLAGLLDSESLSLLAALVRLGLQSLEVLGGSWLCARGCPLLELRCNQVALVCLTDRHVGAGPPDVNHALLRDNWLLHHVGRVLWRLTNRLRSLLLLRLRLEVDASKFDHGSSPGTEQGLTTPRNAARWRSHAGHLLQRGLVVVRALWLRAVPHRAGLRGNLDLLDAHVAPVAGQRRPVVAVLALARKEHCWGRLRESIVLETLAALRGFGVVELHA